MVEYLQPMADAEPDYYDLPPYADPCQEFTFLFS